jgi:hypothetical protein
LNARRGRPSWLAREIKVPPQLVTDWFAKRKTPTWEQGLPFWTSIVRGQNENDLEKLDRCSWLLY